MNLSLREVRADDLPALVEMLGDPRQVRFIEFDTTPSSAQALLDRSLRTVIKTPRTAYSLALTDADDAAIGVCSLVMCELPSLSGSLGIVLQRQAQGKELLLRQAACCRGLASSS